MAKSVAKKAATKTAKKSATEAAKITKFVAPVAPDDYRTDEYQTGDTPKKATAKKSNKTVKATKTVAPVATAKKSNPIIEKCIALMLRKEGARIADFQTVEGFNLPSMAIVKAAQRAGYKAEASKQPGERTVYKAVRP
jgi:hypothetical protein